MYLLTPNNPYFEVGRETINYVKQWLRLLEKTFTEMRLPVEC